MALAALIIATEEEGAEGTSVRSFGLRLFGMPLLEYQARQAAAAGARHIIVYAERVSADLVSALDHLKADGLAVVIVRTAREAADAIHPDELAIIFAGAVQADLSFLKAQCEAREPVIFTRPLVPNLAGQELIDADHAWCGVALLPGELLRNTATLLGDWDLAPTLLRLGVQAGVKRLSLVGEAAHAVSRASAAALLADGNDTSWHKRLSGVLARSLANLPYRVNLLAVLPLIILLGTLALAVMGWIAAALALFVVLAVPAAAIERLTVASLHRSRWLSLYEVGRPFVGRLLILLSAIALKIPPLGWEPIIVGLWTLWLLFMVVKQPAPFQFNETTVSILIFLGLLSPIPIAGLALALGLGLASTLKARFSAQA